MQLINKPKLSERVKSRIYGDHNRDRMI